MSTQAKRTVEGPPVSLDRAAVLEAASCLYAMGRVFVALNDRIDSEAGEYVDGIADALLIRAFEGEADASVTDELRVHTYVRGEEMASDLFQSMLGDEWAPSNIPDLDLEQLFGYHVERARIYHERGRVDLTHEDLPSPPRSKNGSAELASRLSTMALNLGEIRAKLEARNAAESYVPAV